MHTHHESGGSVPAFLAKLWRLVEDPSTDKLICWNKDGLSFIIKNQSKFARELLPLNYKHNNMASFIRQLNMYGFHKIASIENGGLKFDRDEIEFSHPCFKRDCAYLLEHIKRKIANTKIIDDKSTMKPEAVNKVLSEVKAMRGRQESLDSRFNIIKQENETLWSEIAVLRQKHAKQQQIVNKLIQFLVTMVQPARNMTGVKRNFQLMINDTPQNVQLRKANETVSGPIIRELTEELLDGVAETDPDFITMSPSSDPPSNQLDAASPMAQIEMFNESSNLQFEQSNQSPGEVLLQSNNADNNSGILDASKVYYHVSEFSEESGDGQYFSKNDDSNIIKIETDQESENLQEIYKSHIENQHHEKNQKLLKKLEKNQRQEVNKGPVQSNRQQQSLEKKTNLNKKRLLKHSTVTAAPSSSRNKKLKPNPVENNTESIDPLTFLETSYSEPSTNTGTAGISNLKQTEESTKISNSNEKSTTDGSYNDFLTNDYVTDFFDEAAILDDISLPNAGYNEKIDFDKMRSPSTSLQPPNALNIANEINHLEQYPSNSKTSSGGNLTLAKFNNGSKCENNEDIMRLSTAEDVNEHLGVVQDDLESLKTMLRGEGYTLDANTLFSNTASPSRLYLSQPLDGDMLAKLFGDSDALNPFNDYQFQNDNYNNTGEPVKTGSELMTYQPSLTTDPFEMLNMEDQNSTDPDENKQNLSTNWVLNTPSHE